MAVAVWLVLVVVVDSNMVDPFDQFLGEVSTWKQKGRRDIMRGE